MDNGAPGLPLLNVQKNVVVAFKPRSEHAQIRDQDLEVIIVKVQTLGTINRATLTHVPVRIKNNNVEWCYKYYKQN